MKTLDYLKKLCQWVQDVKGITKIGVIELFEFIPEYEKCIAEKTVFHQLKLSSKCNWVTTNEERYKQILSDLDYVQGRISNDGGVTWQVTNSTFFRSQQNQS